MSYKQSVTWSTVKVETISSRTTVPLRREDAAELCSSCPQKTCSNRRCVSALRPAGNKGTHPLLHTGSGALFSTKRPITKGSSEAWLVNKSFHYPSGACVTWELLHKGPTNQCPLMVLLCHNLSTRIKLLVALENWFLNVLHLQRVV